MKHFELIALKRRKFIVELLELGTKFHLVLIDIYLNASTGSLKEAPIITPLMEFIRQKRAAKNGPRVLFA